MTTDSVDESVTLRIDGDTVASGVGADVLGHPLVALAWLADGVDGIPAEAVDGLLAGTVVSTGSLTKPIPVESGESVLAAFQSLGAVELRVR